MAKAKALAYLEAKTILVALEEGMMFVDSKLGFDAI
jgi:hypothetical protein